MIDYFSLKQKDIVAIKKFVFNKFKKPVLITTVEKGIKETINNKIIILYKEYYEIVLCGVIKLLK